MPFTIGAEFLIWLNQNAAEQSADMSSKNDLESLMRAAVVLDSQGPTYREFPDPVPSEGQVLVDVTAAGVNPIDLILASAHTSARTFEPIVPGREGVGRVGERRVYFSALGNPYGSMAEKSLAVANRLIDVPDQVSGADALALGIAGLTAWLSLSRSALIQKGDHVVILGASGAVGQLAVQAARILGAGRIVAAARSIEGLQRAKASGAHAVVRLTDQEDPTESLKAAAEGRIDIIIDPIWGAFAVAALQAASPGARMIQIGNSAAQSFSLNPAFMRMGEKKVIGFSSSVASAEERAELFKRLCGHKLSGEMGIQTEEIPLSDVSSAWKRQASFPHKKLVLTV